MRIYIVAARLWHAPQLIDGFRALNHEVILLSAQRYADSSPIFPYWIIKVLDRLGPLRYLGNIAFSISARKRTMNADLIILWSSYGFAFRKKDETKKLILIRGNSHIVDQLKVLKLKGFKARLNRYFEETDYKKAHLISVPTEMIGSSNSWKNLPVEVNPYAFPFVDNKGKTTQISSPTRLFFVGALTYRKGADRLINIFENQILDIEFSVVGKVELKFRRQIPSWWNVIGYMQPDLVPTFLESQDILVLLSREEGMARVGLEAIAHGKPIIVTKECGLSKWVELGCGVEVPSEPNFADIESALKLITENFESFSNSCKAVSKSWTWSDHAKELLRQIRI
jgi:glycosyltransferase involved in cell wall biosynthesis